MEFVMLNYWRDFIKDDKVWCDRKPSFLCSAIQVFHSLYKVGRNGNIGIDRFKNTKNMFPIVGLDPMPGLMTGL